MKAPESVKRLIERFHEHLDDYKSGTYKEEQVCAEFILPMFKGTSWNA